MAVPSGEATLRRHGGQLPLGSTAGLAYTVRSQPHRIRVRSEQIATHYRCNQGCTFCTARRSSDDPAFIATAAVKQRIAQAAQRGAREIVLTGGEPSMRRDLTELVQFARAEGAQEVTLESNGTLIDAARIGELQKAGLTLLRLHLPAWGDDCDRLTRDPGGFARTKVALEAALGAQLPVEVAATLVKSTGVTLPTIIEHLSQLPNFEGLRGLVVAVAVDSPDPAELLDNASAAAVLAQLDEQARRVGLAVRLAPDSGPPPCLLPHPGRLAHLYAMAPGAGARPGYRQLAECAQCLVADRCPGIRTGVTHPTTTCNPSVKPIIDDRLRRRLTRQGSVADQVRREFSQANRYVDRRSGQLGQEQLIRINFHCNQACRFCFVSTHLPAPAEAMLREAIVEAAQAGKQVTLTGGEPTLNPRLIDYIRLAKAHSPLLPVALQSNAIRLADPALTSAVIAAGIGWVQVSLHGSHAELAEAMSDAPGTFAGQVAGIDQLHRHPSVYLTINFVMAQRNFADLVAFVELCAQRWPRATVTLSFVGPSSDVVPKDASMVPSYTDVLPHLLAAMARAEELGVDLGGLESMCGMPLCLLPERYRQSAQSEIPEGYDQGEFIHPPACNRCELRANCFGVRRNYLALYGDGELRPLPQVAQAPG